MFRKTDQEWFNGAWERSRIKAKASDDEGNCAYRDTNTPGCFIGCQVPEHIELEEGTAACDQPIKVFNFSTEDSDHFLNDLQAIHDLEEPERWKEDLILFAKLWTLDIPEDQ